LDQDMEQFPARLRRQYHDDIARDARALKKWASGLPAATSHPTPADCAYRKSHVRPDAVGT
jgi:hypothetical protein